MAFASNEINCISGEGLFETEHFQPNYCGILGSGVILLRLVESYTAVARKCAEKLPKIAQSRVGNERTAPSRRSLKSGSGANT